MAETAEEKKLRLQSVRYKTQPPSPLLKKASPDPTYDAPLPPSGPIKGGKQDTGAPTEVFEMGPGGTLIRKRQ